MNCFRGSLSLTARERLLEALAEPDLSPERETPLREALADLDTAWVGTIHSFADRLLRLRPVEAELSPAYEIVDDDEELVRETWEVLLHAIQTDTLETELAGTGTESRAGEVTRSMLLALGAELRAESRETEFWTFYGLDALVGAFIRWRDVQPAEAEPAAFDAVAFQAAARAFTEVAAAVQGPSHGARWIQTPRRG